nr:reverse transcriptase domain-containing protein [Tanacetum cinerariifolium]
MANRTMEELLQAPTEGYREAIFIPKILAENFEIKMSLLQLVQTNKFHGFERDNPHTHIKGAAKIWYEKEHPNSILTWDDLVNKFVNQFFPPSKTTHLKNEISRFTQRFEETFGEAWERFKEMLRACHHHEFSELTQKDTFYNGLNELDQDSLNFMAGGNLLSKTTREALEIIENKSKGFQNQPFSVPNNPIQPSIPNELSSYMKSNETLIRNVQNQSNVLRGDFNKQEENLRRNLNNDMRSILGSFFQNQTSTSGTFSSNTVPNPKGEMKAVTTCSVLAYDGPLIPINSPLEKVVERDTEEKTDKEHSNYQGSTAHIQPSVIPISILKPDVPRTQPKPTIPYPSRLNDQKLREKATNQMEKSLLTNKDKLFELAKVPLNENCSAMLLKKLPKKLGDPEKFLIPCDFSGIDVCHALADLADRLITHPKGVAEDEFVKVGKFHFPTDFVVVDFEADPRVTLILGRYFLRAGCALIDVYGEEITLRVNDESYNFKSSNPTLVSNPSISKSDFCKKPIVKCSSPTLTPFRESDLFLEEIEDFLNDVSIPTGIENSLYDPEGDILYLEKLLNEDPFQLPLMDLKQAEETKAKSSIEEPRYFQIPIDPQDQEKTIFTCPYGTFAYRRMPFGLCNAPGTFQREGIVLGHKISNSGIEVERAKVDKKLTEAPILVVPDWNLPFELMCDASDFAIGAVLGQHKTKHFQPIHYASQTMTEAQIHYTTTEKEMLAVVYTFEKFRPYLVLSKSIVYTDHSALKYLLNKQDAKSRLLRWVLLLQEFDITILDRKGSENLAANHLSRLENPHKDVLENKDINENFSLETLGSLSSDIYHPQTSGQVEVSNRGLKRILERTVGENRTSWSDKLDDALWAFRTAFKTPIERTKKLHDSKFKNHIFNVGDQVLLFNSRFKIFSGKLKTHWSGPFTITQVFSYGTVDLSQPNGPNFKVNGHRVKHYFEGDIPSKD